MPSGSDPGYFVQSSTATNGNGNKTSNSHPTGINTWALHSSSPAVAPLREAAHLLRTTDTPVAFPTETVYGLGADATRSAAVRGIYAAKGRPSDNPLIVHVCDLDMLRSLLLPSSEDGGEGPDPIPEIYRPLLQRFWPGPLTILLRTPTPSPLAPEVTAQLPTFGARMPASPLARSLIRLAEAPLAAPSANASTRPSPTSASHVAEDLEGRIELILDGGSCGVGVESTVVDGLCVPPVVLRPGGVGMEELRSVKGWEGVVKGYEDGEEKGPKGPRAPGMKYKHYSPRARVVLFEAGVQGVEAEVKAGNSKVVGVVRTQRWDRMPGEELGQEKSLVVDGDGPIATNGNAQTALGYEIAASVVNGVKVLDIALGRDTKMVAQGLFSALRELDRLGAEVIFVEGVEDGDDIAEAVMNRLRKAASEVRA